MKKHIVGIAFVALSAATIAGPALADTFITSPNREMVLEVIDSKVPGADRFVFVCIDGNHCNGEYYAVKNEKNTVKFTYGNRNVLTFWKNGSKRMNAELRDPGGAVIAKAVLRKDASAKPATIPNLSLILSSVGITISIADDLLEYCPAPGRCATGEVHAVGDRLAISEVGVGEEKWGHVMVARHGPSTQYSVSFHENGAVDPTKYQVAIFQVDVKTTSALK